MFILLLLGVGAVKAVETTDRVVLSELTVEPGGSGEAVLTVSLEGSLKYTAYQMSFVLPEGLEVSVTDGYYDVYMSGTSGFYPQRGNAHSLGANVVDGVLNVACFSSNNAEFSKTSGELFSIILKASPYLKPGVAPITVKGVRLVTVDEVKFEPVDYESAAVEVGTTSSLELKVSATNKFGTCILPFDYALPADGSLTAYACSEHTDDALVLSRVDALRAYTPYILHSDNGFSATISGTVDPAKYPAEGIVKSGHLVGAVVPNILTEGSYVMQNQGAGTMFYRVGATPFSLAAGKCYVEMPAGVSAASFRLGTTTSIDDVQQTAGNAKSIYNVLGQKVDKVSAGHIYIVDGKKMIAE